MPLKTLIALTIAAVISAVAYPAGAEVEECKYMRDGFDPFSNEKRMTTRWNPLTGWLSDVINQSNDKNAEINVLAIVRGQQKLIAMQLKLSDTTKIEPTHSEIRDAISIPQGARLHVSMADGSFVDLYAEKTVEGYTRANYEDGIFVIKTTITAVYPLDAAATATLSNQNASSVQVAVSSRKYAFTENWGLFKTNIHEKARGNIRQVLDCIT